MTAHHFGTIEPFLLRSFCRLSDGFDPNRVKVVKIQNKTVELEGEGFDPINRLFKTKFYVSAKPKAAGSSTSSADDFQVMWDPMGVVLYSQQHPLKWGLGFRVVIKFIKNELGEDLEDPEDEFEAKLQILDFFGQTVISEHQISLPSQLEWVLRSEEAADPLLLGTDTETLEMESCFTHHRIIKNGKVVFHTGHFLRTLDLEKPEFKAWSKLLQYVGWRGVNQAFDSESRDTIKHGFERCLFNYWEGLAVWMTQCALTATKEQIGQVLDQTIKICETVDCLFISRILNIDSQTLKDIEYLPQLTQVLRELLQEAILKLEWTSELTELLGSWSSQLTYLWRELRAERIDLQTDNLSEQPELISCGFNFDGLFSDLVSTLPSNPKFRMRTSADFRSSDQRVIGPQISTSMY